ncbi:ABC-2 type transport system ATP-binding protein [Cupriavidus alkaliphilus]|uniref:ABC transporter ATP-binding protein n=1 Tax=Cupriavidus alkaliphilus TaxID=942866 RepID=UPI000DE6F370|nr:ABC transporter ATP-binding protein [Cupriavidus alkaliphilus]PVY77910.1 ABC-2 type transport system ATP-binding protein [Cupriavidus alkaliphilus]
MLEIRDLVVLRDGRRVVDSLRLRVPRGCVYALLGGNGAGKTTTIDAILGFVPPAAGVVRVDGLSPLAEPIAVRRRVAYLPENVALYPYLSGVENLDYFCAMAGIALSRTEAVALLDGAGLAREAQDRRVGAYSKGMRQKVGLAIAEARSASLLLLDEPTSGLDPAAADDMAQRVRKAADAGMAVLMATHDLFHARQLADRIGILRAGVLVAEFDAATLDHQALTAAYLAHARAPGSAS